MAAPDDARAGWDLSGAAREAYVRRLFDGIAAPYDRLNRLISLGRDERWRRLVVRLSGVGPRGRVLDLGTGTGDLALAFADAVGPEGRVVGIDLAAGMLGVARRKVRERGGASLLLARGNASATAMPGAWADAVSMGWVLRNVGDRQAVYAEVLRVLRPGGTFVSIDMSRPRGAIARAGAWFYCHALMPLLARLGGGNAGAYRYLAASTDRFPDAASIAAELRAAGFVEVEARPLMLGALAVHVARRPR